MDKRLDAFSTGELTMIYQALAKQDEARSDIMREQIRQLLDHRKVVMDKIFGVTEGMLSDETTSTQSAGYRAYWAGASDAEAAACDREEL